MGDMSLSRRAVLAGVLGGAALPAVTACGSATAPAPTAGEELARLEDLPDGQSTVVSAADGTPFLLTRSGGEVTALSASCTHQGCAVRVEGSAAACPCHGSRFALPEGAVLQGPATQPLPAVQVEVSDGVVVVA